MRIVTTREVENWLASGKVLEQDGRGPKVVALGNGPEKGLRKELILKIFHTRRLPLLARLQPAARRFAKNAEILKKLDIPAPEVREIFWLDPASGLSACLYAPLPGLTLEALFRQTPEGISPLLPRLAHFIQRLHRQKIYFRSLHIGNILLLPDGNFGLIDILDLKRTTLPLGPLRIRRNLRHLTRHLERRHLTAFPADELCRLYWQETVSDAGQ
jgi:hypothetical protein